MAETPDEPLVSVVIPTRNRPVKLQRAVESVCEQTYGHLEIIVVDDGSDPPASIDSDGRDCPPIRVSRLASPEGSGRARNHGAQLAGGELIAFLDDDDEWLPRHLQTQVDVLRRARGRVSAVESGHEGWRDGKLLYTQRPSLNRETSIAILKEPRVFTSSVLMKKDRFDQAGGFEPDLQRHQDWVLWARMFQSYELLSVDDVTVKRDINDWITPEQRLIAYRDVRARLDPLIAALPALDRYKVKVWHSRTHFIRWGNASFTKHGVDWLWDSLIKARRGAHRIGARMRRRDPREEIW